MRLKPQVPCFGYCRKCSRLGVWPARILLTSCPQAPRARRRGIRAPQCAPRAPDTLCPSPVVFEGSFCSSALWQTESPLQVGLRGPPNPTALGLPPCKTCRVCCFLLQAAGPGPWTRGPFAASFHPSLRLQGPIHRSALHVARVAVLSGLHGPSECVPPPDGGGREERAQRRGPCPQCALSSSPNSRDGNWFSLLQMGKLRLGGVRGPSRATRLVQCT